MKHLPAVGGMELRLWRWWCVLSAVCWLSYRLSGGKCQSRV